jgi:hypothetical protein
MSAFVFAGTNVRSQIVGTAPSGRDGARKRPRFRGFFFLHQGSRRGADIAARLLLGPI